MSERTPQPSPPPREKEEQRSWAAATIAATLGAQAEPRFASVHGQGARLRLGKPAGFDLEVLPGHGARVRPSEAATLELELFPAIQMVRLSTLDLSLNLVQQTPPRVAAAGGLFDAPNRALLIRPTGEALLRIGRPNPVERPVAPARSAEAPITQDMGREGLSDDLTAPEPFP